MRSFIKVRHMGDTIFTDKFSEVKSDKELEKVKNKYPKYDPYYIASGCTKERRERFDKLWQIYKSLADKHFLSEAKKHFHQRTWEMYLGAVLIKNKLNIFSPDKGPDFVINKDRPGQFFIEATACERGETKDMVPNMIYNMVQDVPEEEMLVRLANSLSAKYKKYKNFIKKENKPYIIAINKGELDHPDPQIPLILKCLFGIGHQHFKKINGKLTYAGWTSRKFIEKKNKSQVSMDFFGNQNHNIVSAIMYSNKTILNHPPEIGSDCIIVHNPNTSKPIDIKVFSFLKQYKAGYDKDGLHVKAVN